MHHNSYMYFIFHALSSTLSCELFLLFDWNTYDLPSVDLICFANNCCNFT